MGGTLRDTDISCDLSSFAPSSDSRGHASHARCDRSLRCADGASLQTLGFRDRSAWQVCFSPWHHVARGCRGDACVMSGKCRVRAERLPWSRTLQDNGIRRQNSLGDRGRLATSPTSAPTMSQHQVSWKGHASWGKKPWLRPNTL